MERGPKGASDRVVSDRKRIYIYKYIYNRRETDQ